ncbi:DUF6471 domain-containing protein [Marinomonas sp. C2222]|uniref:DUF6471 domain-containing protein n=1 Tax=Marinomonas sargassi TaxID=2984494 RepID=A0ABT2YU99_9GAMM|nr:DUF6471 domain-containing protein [Marinomonas sargassi]MCV2403184.1 DUF6471 domain-containing protein [Marinomonas sargassi]
MNQDQSIKNRHSLSPYKLAITRYIRSSLALKGLKYDDLCELLQRKGITMTPENLRSKTHKGMFSADLFTAIIDVLELEEDALKTILKEAKSA